MATIERINSTYSIAFALISARVNDENSETPNISLRQRGERTDLLEAIPNIDNSSSHLSNVSCTVLQ